MRKYTMTIILVLLVLFIGLAIVLGLRNKPRVIDERQTFRSEDVIPYGTKASYELLSRLFPSASIESREFSLEAWSAESEGSKGAVIFLSNHFLAEEEELENLTAYAREGNYVYIIASALSYGAENYFGLDLGSQFIDENLIEEDDSLRIRLEAPAFRDTQTYIYPGKKRQSYLFGLDTARTQVLGRNEYGTPNFIKLNAGSGAIFIHTVPMAFTNYFVLHKKNHQYLEAALSVIPADVDKITWNEYYLKRRSSSGGEPNWLRVLMRNESLKWALLTGLATLVLYVILGMRRKQRSIPFHARPKNDSLDFVKTLGRLYYDKRDHKNLAQKMGSYFLEHVHSRYKLPTQQLDEEFISRLYLKSGYSREELEYLVGFIRDLQQLPALSESQLYRFHHKLELFYQNT